MSLDHAPTVAIHRATPPTSSTATQTTIDDELRRDNSRRLGAIGLAYAIGYTLAFGSAVAILATTGVRLDLTEFLVALAFITLGLAVFVVSRRRELSRAQLRFAADGLLIVGSVGILIHSWGWEQAGRDQVRLLGELVGIGPDHILDRFVQPLADASLPLFTFEGVAWVGVWILNFPLLIPTRPRRALIVSLIGVTASIAVPGVSVLVNGMPAEIAPWGWAYFGQLAAPLYICCILAYVGARTGYGIRRQLSRARRLGSYQLGERLGHGGMGEVWMATHRMLARPAAIKVIRPEALATSPSVASTAVRRFEREARATARLQSPHTIEVYDFGTTRDGAFFYVMELLDGFDLRTLVERFGPLSPSRAIHVLAQACHSLHDAHASGLVHRDVKPANLFVCRRGIDLDVVKVLDFGLVKEIRDVMPDARLTMAGTTTGTPAFMAPELITSGVEAEPRADLYALGGVGYWLVTGTLVFDGATPMAILARHVNETPPPPSTRTELPIPDALEALLLRCLDKDPDARPASAWELREALLALDVPAWSPDDAAAWWSRHAPAPDTTPEIAPA